MSNLQNQKIVSGDQRPDIVLNEELYTNSVFMDSRNASYKNNEWDFVVSLGGPQYRCRGFKATRVVLPKINNITINNNRVSFVHSDGGGDFSLTPGIYGPTDFVNEFVSKMNAALLGIGTDSIVGSYDSTTRKVTFTSNIAGKRWFFVDTCTFVVRGKNFCPFSSFPVSSGVGIVGSGSHVSGVAAFLYSRYFTIHSSAICGFEYAPSRTSAVNTPGKILCIADISQLYSDSDFSAGTNFTTNIGVVDVEDSSSYIKITNHSKNFNNIVDIQCFDEFAITMADSLKSATNDNTPQLGVSIFGNFYF